MFCRTLFSTHSTFFSTMRQCNMCSRGVEIGKPNHSGIGVHQQFNAIIRVWYYFPSCYYYYTTVQLSWFYNKHNLAINLVSLFFNFVFKYCLIIQWPKYKLKKQGRLLFNHCWIIKCISLQSTTTISMF